LVEIRYDAPMADSGSTGDFGDGGNSGDGPRVDRPPRMTSDPRVQRPIGGIVSDRREPKTAPSFGRFLFRQIGAAISAVLITLGVMRPRNPDGTLGPRSWKRLGTSIAIAFAIVFVWTSIHIVKPGTVAVPVTLGHAGKPLSAGFHITLPFTSAYGMSVRTQNYTMSSSKLEGGSNSAIDDSVAVLGSDGGAANVNATVLYRLDPRKATDVYRTLGAKYTTQIIRPTARTCIRTQFTLYTIVEAATTAWRRLESEVAQCMKSKIEPRGVLLQEFQLREVALSAGLQTAVNNKVASQQNAQQQKFELLTARQAADITRIQALATADSQQILACGGKPATMTRDGQVVQTVVPNPISECSQAQLTPAYLQFSYIQALKQLVNSPNNSTIILPFDKNLTPLIQLPTNGTSGTGAASGTGATTGNSTPTSSP
jgi:regulator of protease activity HflC (stomatin/prohibitin superfamily)